jgi:hypothetical protein
MIETSRGGKSYFFLAGFFAALFVVFFETGFFAATIGGPPFLSKGLELQGSYHAQTTTASKKCYILHHPYADQENVVTSSLKLESCAPRRQSAEWRSPMEATDRIRLTIDLEQVARNLRTPDGSTVGEGTARCYLRQVGFSPDTAGTWVGPRSGLGRLNHSEVVRIEPVAP